MAAIENEVPGRAVTIRRVIVAPPRAVGSPRPVRSGAAPTEDFAPVAPAVPAAPAASPTTSIGRVLLTLAVAMLLSLVLGARGLVHAGQGMQDGTERSVVLAVGQRVLDVSGAVDLTWPWDRVEAALGRAPQTGSPLLAASAPSPVLVSRSSRPVPRTTVGKQTISHRPGRGTVARTTPAKPASHATPALFVPTPRHPLRLLATGDSLTEFLGPDLLNDAAATGPIRGFVDTHYGTGLVRPDFVDWSLVAQQQVKADHPDAVVVMIGGNDFQNMTLANGRIIQTLTPAWTREYQRRAEICMRIWTNGGRHRVYWLSMPPARDDAWTRNNQQINLALQRAAARVPGAEYVNILGPVTDHGRYADYVSINGQPTLVRTPDGIHFNETGSAIVAREVLALLKRQWRLGQRSHLPARRFHQARQTHS